MLGMIQQHTAGAGTSGAEGGAQHPWPMSCVVCNEGDALLSVLVTRQSWLIREPIKPVVLALSTGPLAV